MLEIYNDQVIEMLDLDDLHPDYITDENGNKKAVILSISDFQELIEDLEDLAAIAERRDEPLARKIGWPGTRGKSRKTSSLLD